MTYTDLSPRERHLILMAADNLIHSPNHYRQIDRVYFNYRPKIDNTIECCAIGFLMHVENDEAFHLTFDRLEKSPLVNLMENVIVEERTDDCLFQFITMMNDKCGFTFYEIGRWIEMHIDQMKRIQSN